MKTREQIKEQIQEIEVELKDIYRNQNRITSQKVLVLVSKRVYLEQELLSCPN